MAAGTFAEYPAAEASVIKVDTDLPLDAGPVSCGVATGWGRPPRAEVRPGDTVGGRHRWHRHQRRAGAPWPALGGSSPSTPWSSGEKAMEPGATHTFASMGSVLAVTEMTWARWLTR